MTERLTLALGALALMSGLLVPRLASAQSREAPSLEAAYLSANCTNCHGPQGRSAGGVPSLAGLPRAYIIEQMQAFRAGTRPATIMHQLAKGYTDAQFESMAVYFSSLPKP